MKSLLNSNIPKEAKGVIYLFDDCGKILKEGFYMTKLKAEQAFDTYFIGMNAELILGSSYDQLCSNLDKFHKQLKNGKDRA